MASASRKTPLPHVMVAPNGARRGRSAHEAIPLSDDELVDTAIACQKAGADGIHMHIRDQEALHLLDVGRYRSLLSRLQEAVPQMYLQVTSEAAGIYDAKTQQDMMRALKPKHVSVALREMVRTEADWPEASQFYQWSEDAGVEVQHIVYSLQELRWFIRSCLSGRITGDHHLLQLVLGSYDGTQISRPEAIQDFVDIMVASRLSFDWGLCAFGMEETSCLIQTARLGGKVRVGFENSLWNADGALAKDNAERVREVTAGIAALR